MNRSIAVLDTNVLLLYLIGQTDSGRLKTFKRVSDFDENDLTLLAGGTLRIRCFPDRTKRV